MSGEIDVILKPNNISKTLNGTALELSLFRMKKNYYYSPRVTLQTVGNQSY
jgi:hypothetical protein